MTYADTEWLGLMPGDGPEDVEVVEWPDDWPDEPVEAAPEPEPVETALPAQTHPGMPVRFRLGRRGGLFIHRPWLDRMLGRR